MRKIEDAGRFVLKDIEELPDQQRALILRLLRLALNTPIAVRAAVAMMEAMAPEETHQNIVEGSRRAG